MNKKLSRLDQRILKFYIIKRSFFIVSRQVTLTTNILRIDTAGGKFRNGQFQTY